MHRSKPSRLIYLGNEAALAHTQGDKVRAAYNRASFDDERPALLVAWGEFLARDAATVVALRSAT